MNRPVTAVFAALESLLVVGIGVGVPVVSLTFLWAFQYGLQIDWQVFYRAGADVWLVGHGVDLTLTLSKTAAAATGIAGASAPILISIAALGFALGTVLLGARTGRRLAETSHRATGSVTAIVSFAAYSFVVAATATQPGATVSIAAGTVLPALVFGIPLLVTAEVNRRRRGAPADPVTAVVLGAVERIPAVGRGTAVVVLRAGAGVAVTVFAAAGLVVGVLLLTHYASIISLYEGAHGGVLGGLALTIGQIALLPNAIAWAASWLVGPGFALGAGSAVSPLGTTLGPLPAVPFLGALPTTTPAFAFIGILVPVVASFVLVTFLRPSIERALGGADTLTTRLIAGAGIGVVSGLVIGLVAGVSSGSAGPGRLASVGPDALLVGAFAALEVGVPAMLALVVKQGGEVIGDLARAAGDKLPERVTSVGAGIVAKVTEPDPGVTESEKAPTSSKVPTSKKAPSSSKAPTSTATGASESTGTTEEAVSTAGLPSLDSVLPRRSSDTDAS